MNIDDVDLNSPHAQRILNLKYNANDAVIRAFKTCGFHTASVAPLSIDNIQFNFDDARRLLGRLNDLRLENHELRQQLENK